MTGNNTSTARGLFRTLLSPLIPIFLAGCVFLFCFRFFAIDPFDVHESLYRRLAEEMKALGTLSTQLTFNAREFSSTSPIYPALLAMMSWLFDGDEPVLSSFSGRFLGVIFSFFSVLIVHRTFRRLMNVSTVSPWHVGQGQRFTGISPVYFFLMSFVFLILGMSFGPASLVILCVAICVCSEALRIFARESKQSTSFFYIASSAFGLTVLSALTSLSVLLVACVASILFCFARRSAFFAQVKNRSDVSPNLQTLLQGFLPQITLASVVSWLFKDTLFARSVIDKSIQSGGVFERAFFAVPMPGFFFAIFSTCGLSFVMGWILLSSLIGQKDSSDGNDQSPRSADNLHWAGVWLLSWLMGSALCSILPVIGERLSLSGLMLPALCLLASLGGRGTLFFRWNRVKKALLTLLYGLSFSLPIVLLALAFLILLMSSGSTSLAFLSEPQNAILEGMLKHSEQLALGLFLTGLFLLIAVLFSRYWIMQALRRNRWPYFFSLGCARTLALVHMLACVSCVLLVLPVLEEVMTGSVQQSTLKAKMFLGVGEKLSTSGFVSPTVISTLKEPVNLWTGRTETLLRDARPSVILLPVWEIETCRKSGFDYAQAVDFFRICLRSYRKTLEGPEKRDF